MIKYIRAYIILLLYLFYIYFLNINNIKLINMYKKSIYSVNVVIAGGLGNRLMSFAGIIILSIYYEVKPICIITILMFSIKLERI